MDFIQSFIDKLTTVNNESFEPMAIDLFRYQYANNTIYQQYCQLLAKDPQNVKKVTEIPFLPISFFKYHKIKTGDWNESQVFLSSGTTGMERSSHFVKDIGLYHQSAKTAFEALYGTLSQYSLYALLPSYQQQGNSSLISMVNYFLQFTRTGSGYYLENDKHLIEKMSRDQGKKILIGVTYALMGLAEKGIQLPDATIVMETGGMKGRGMELTREALHELFMGKLGNVSVHAEYGMTELFSQAYLHDQKGFRFPSWAQVFVRDMYDPFSYLSQEKTGGINIIDLANVHTCAFIETQDVGIKHSNENYFSVLGRFDNSDIRGCNLLVLNQ